MNPKNRKFDKVKAYKKISRENAELHGRGGPHLTNKDRPRRKKQTRDYLAEVEEDGYGDGE